MEWANVRCTINKSLKHAIFRSYWKAQMTVLSSQQHLLISRHSELAAFTPRPSMNLTLLQLEMGYLSVYKNIANQAKKNTGGLSFGVIASWNFTVQKPDR